MALCEISLLRLLMNSTTDMLTGFGANCEQGGIFSRNLLSALSVGLHRFISFDDLNLRQHSFSGWPTLPHFEQRWLS